MSGTPSVLERDFTLAELVDLDSFREVMKTFSDLYRVGVKVFDRDGTKLVDIRVGNGPFCGYLFGFGPTRQACTRLVSGLKTEGFPEDSDGRELPRVVNCFSGLRYVVMPVHFEGDLVGRLVFGPYMPADRRDADEQLFEMEPSLNRETVVRLSRQVRQAPDELVSKVLEQLQKNIEVILFTSYRSLLTTQMHLESVTTSYQELEAKNTELRQANERLKELDKMKSNFLATVSHELRTPLTSVIGYSEMLMEGMAGGLNEEQRDYVKTIMEKGESLLGLISQILDLSRIEAGSMRLNLGHFSLADTLRAATTSVIPQAKKKSIDLVVDIDDKLPERFEGDREKIGQIVVNLLGNAVKFTPENGTVTLAADLWRGPRRAADGDKAADLFDLDEEDFLRVRVTDTGIGIPADKVESIFDRFFQVDNSSTRSYGGSGLGLSIVRNFVDAHGGDIKCESVVEQGSTFTIIFPLER
jgi:signal transduction histidine kinase